MFGEAKYFYCCNKSCSMGNHLQYFRGVLHCCKRINLEIDAYKYVTNVTLEVFIISKSLEIVKIKPGTKEQTDPDGGHVLWLTGSSISLWLLCLCACLGVE